MTQLNTLELEFEDGTPIELEVTATFDSEGWYNEEYSHEDEPYEIEDSYLREKAEDALDAIWSELDIKGTTLYKGEYTLNEVLRK